MRQPLLLAMIPAIFLCGCAKSGTSYAKPTRTMTFKMNGQVHTIQGQPTVSNPDGVYYYLRSLSPTKGGVVVQAENDHEVISLIVIENSMHPVLGQPYVITEFPQYKSSYYSDDPSRNHRFYSDEDSTCILVFSKFDDTGASGTFTFQGSDTAGVKIAVTEGKFNIVTD